MKALLKHSLLLIVFSAASICNAQLVKYSTAKKSYGAIPPRDPARFSNPLALHLAWHQCYRLAYLYF